MMLESAQRRSVVPEVREGIGKAVDELDVTIREIRTAIFALHQGSTRAPLKYRPGCVAGCCARSTWPPYPSVSSRATASSVPLTPWSVNASARTSSPPCVDATAQLPDGQQVVRLTVTDDGLGIPDGGRRSGLRNLKQRAESLGGDSWYGPGIVEDGDGTTVVWQAPH